ncbi:MAG: ABC transporter permease [Gammaproteobacteria bacterium]
MPPAKMRARARWIRLAQLLPSTLFLVAFFLAPLAVFLLYSFWTKRGFEFIADWTTENYASTLGDEVYRSLLQNTVEIGLQASALAVAIAYTFAHVIRFHLQRWQAALLFLVLIAAFSGYLVRVYSWRTILGNNGIINETLQRLGVIDEPLSFLLYSRTATIIVLGNFLVPFALVPIYAALQNVQNEEVEVARDLGCGPVRALFKVTLPLAWPGIFAAFALCFIVAAGDYVTPQLVGGTSGTMIGRAISDSFGVTFEWPTGAALSFITLATALVIIALVRALGAVLIR